MSRMGHVMQFSPGYFVMNQGGVQVGQLVAVPGSGGSVVEYWYLFASSGSGQPIQGYGYYTWPSSTNTNVTTNYVYQGTIPSGWSSSNPAAYKTTLQQQLGAWVNPEYVRAQCTAPQMQAKKSGGGKKKAAKATPKKKGGAKKKGRR